MKTIFVLSALALSGAARAASVSCDTSFLDYRITVRATASGSRLGSRASVTVTRGGAPLRSGSMPVVSGRFVPGRSLAFVAEDRNGRIEVSAAFASGNTYTGTLAASSPQGGTSAAATCVVR